MMHRGIFLGVLLLVLGIAACGPAASTFPSAPGGEPKAFDAMVMIPADREAALCETGKEVWRSKETPKRGGVFNMSASSPNLDFTKGSAVGLSTIPQVYDMLMKPRTCFAEDTVIVPSLAKSWTISPDGRTWTLSLRDDVKWHNMAPVNGRTFTSADVAWTIDYQVKEGVLKNFWEGVGHEEPNATAVILKLQDPRPDFIQQLGFHTNIMLPREVREQQSDFKSSAIGTGAYMLKDFKPAQSSVLVRNPDYYRKGADGKTLPYIDEVHTFAFGDRASESAALRGNQVHFASASDILEVRDFQANYKDKLRPHLPRQGSIHAIWFNGAVKPWDDVRVRKAVSLAINREDIVIGSRKGGAVPSGFLPAVVAPYAWPEEKLKEKFKYDPEAAKKLLTEAGMKPGDIRVELHTTGSYSQDAEVVVEQLKAVGIIASVLVRDMGISGGGGSSLIMAKGDYEIAWAVLAPTYFPDYWAYDIVRTGSRQNIVRVSDAEIDRLADAQHKEFDEAKRKQLIDQLQDREYEMMVFVPVQSLYYTPVYSCQMKNFQPKHYTYQLEGVVEGWIDPQGKC